MHSVGQFVDRGEVLRALPGVVADFEDRVGDESRRDDSLGTAATPARCPGPHPEASLDWRLERGLMVFLNPSRDNRIKPFTASLASLGHRR